MLQLDILGLIPQSLKQQALATLVDLVSEQAKKVASEELAAKIKKLRSDASFNQAFEEGLERAARRFVEGYEVEDEDLVAAIAADEDFFKKELSQTQQRIGKGTNLECVPPFSVRVVPCGNSLISPFVVVFSMTGMGQPLRS